MPLRDESWTSCNLTEILDGWFRAEVHRFEGLEPRDHPLVKAVLDLSNATVDAVRTRRDLIGQLRRPILDRLPADTTWHRVEHLRAAHVDELHVIGRCGWDDPQRLDANELRAVAVRKRDEEWIELRGEPSAWGIIILWGHGREGPFTIMEGNHRLTAYAAAAGPPPLDLPVYVGLSAEPCVFHKPDPDDHWLRAR